ncbi:hypothetical protein LTR22_024477 [Elasticomyces elasticus]|nr:hypothetical protein LTR22_024477 [Elasticomyces elasticus]
METFVHTDDPLKVFQNFSRLIQRRPYGADFHWALKEGSYKQLLQEAGFGEINPNDYSENVLPLWRLSGIIGAISYDLLRFFQLQKRFTNILAGIEAYRHWVQGRYISIRAVYP